MTVYLKNNNTKALIIMALRALFDCLSRQLSIH
jgi:hypothetical protein